MIILFLFIVIWGIGLIIYVCKSRHERFNIGLLIALCLITSLLGLMCSIGITSKYVTKDSFKNKEVLSTNKIYDKNDYIYWKSDNNIYTMSMEDEIPTVRPLIDIEYSNEVNKPIIKHISYKQFSKWYYYIYMWPIEYRGYILVLPENYKMGEI